MDAWKEWIARGVRDSYPSARDVRVTNAVVVPELTAMLQKRIEPHRERIAQQAQLDASMGMRSFIVAKVLAFERSYTRGAARLQQRQRRVPAQQRPAGGPALALSRLGEGCPGADTAC